MLTHTGSFLINAQTCRNAGRLNTEGTSLEQATTYIIPSYRIECDGVVTGWKFCYQVIGTPSVTFYPSVWRWNDNNLYTLVRVSTINYISPLNPTFVCDNYTLPVSQQFAVLRNDTIGLYTTQRSQILRTGDSNDRLTYSVDGNHSSVMIVENNGLVEHHQFHVAIVANISE